MAEKLSTRQQAFTKHIAALITYAESQGLGLTFGEAWRSPETQAMYVAQGKSQTRNSRHIQRLAVDFNVFVNDTYCTDGAAYEPLGRYWCSLDTRNRWGGDWRTLKDYNHFEMT